MRILLVSATPFEISPCLQWLETQFQKDAGGFYSHEQLEIHPLITGVGLSATGFAIGRYTALAPFDWAINAGIAGAYDANLAPGTVVQVRSECFGDLGVEEQDGTFTSLHETGLIPTFTLENPHAALPGLTEVSGASVNRVHGSEESIRAFRTKFPDIQVESMEGAAFFQACLALNIPFVEIRSISNRVEPRNKANWKIPLAIQQLNDVLIGMLDALR